MTLDSSSGCSVCKEGLGSGALSVGRQFDCGKLTVASSAAQRGRRHVGKYMHGTEKRKKRRRAEYDIIISTFLTVTFFPSTDIISKSLFCPHWSAPQIFALQRKSFDLPFVACNRTCFLIVCHVCWGRGVFSVWRPGSAVCGDTTKECVVEGLC